MSTQRSFDEELLRRLPLPLAQLYQRAHYGKTPLEQYLTSYYLWEASLKLLGSAAIIGYAELSRHDAQLAERLRNLARPALGHWWEFVRLLVPVLADAGDGRYVAVRDLVLGRTRDDLPRAAGLDAVLREMLEGTAAARSSVRLSELIDRLIRHRNHELGHGAAGQRDSAFYSRMARTLLAAGAELLSRCDVLAGRRLVLITDVRRQPTGGWLIEWRELLGERPRILEPVSLPNHAAGQLPLPGKLYLAEPPSPSPGAADSSSQRKQEGPAAVPVLRCLHPLLVYDGDSDETFFLNSRRGRQRIEYLSYTSGRVIDREELLNEERALLGRVLDMTVEPPQAEEWAARSQAEEPSPEQADMPSNAPPLRRLGEFEVLSKLGQGGMGAVYRAWQSSLGRQVALKALLRSGDAKAEARFFREIHALGRVEHPHLVKIFTSGSEGDQWFYAMELIEGATLGAVCEKLQSRNSAAAALDLPTWQGALSTVCQESRKAETPLSGTVPPRPPAAHHAPAGASQETSTTHSYVRHVAELVRQAAQAAHALHEAGVVHRDIKPGNIMVSVDGTQAVLMDLGLAQLADEVEGKLTRTRQFVGTLRYASPEQILAVNRVDRRSDVYSLGATLWELLTLRPLFAATEQTPTPDLMQRIQYEDPEGVRKHNRRVGKDLEAIVLKCLEKDPRRRYATAQELADDLQRFLSGEGVQARPSRVARTWRRIRRRPVQTAGVLLLGVLLVAGWFAYGYWDTHYRTKTEYYATFVKRWRQPEGIGRLSESQARQRALVWKVHRRGQRVERIDALNGSGQPTTNFELNAIIRRPDDVNTECSYVYKRNEQGEVAEQIALDRAGQPVWLFHYSTPTTGYFADQRGFPRARGGTGAAFVEFEYTPEGFEKTIRYLDRSGKPQPSGDGIFELRQDFSERGQVVAAACLGADKRPALHREGYASGTLKYDDDGNLIEVALFGLDGKPAPHKNGFATVTLKYDVHGNRVESASFGVNGSLIHNREGFATWTAKYDERGNMIAQAYFGTDGLPTLNKDGVAKFMSKFDDRGNRIETSLYSIDGLPTLHKNGYAMVKNKYDERGNRVEEVYFDRAGQPTTVKRGFCKFIGRFDERGRQIEDAFFDRDGRPVLVDSSFARAISKYDEHGSKIEAAYFGLDGKPTLHKNGQAKWKAKYDDRGNEVERRFFGTDDRPIIVKDGYARWNDKHDDRGNQVETAYFNTEDQPTLKKDGYAVLKIEYDDRANEVRRSYFGPDGRPTKHKNGYHAAAFKYDDFARQIETAHFDEAGRPAVDKNGHARWTTKYDARGHAIEEAYFGADGRAAVFPQGGFAKMVSKYDERGNRVEVTYFDRDGRPSKHSEGYHKAAYKYDELGRRIETAFLDDAGRPVADRDGHARWTVKYDAQGNRVETAYFGLDGRPAIFPALGYAKITAKHDDRGNAIEEAYFGVDGRPVKQNDGYHKSVGIYDEYSRNIEVRYLDEAGRPAGDQDGHARLTWKFDARGQLIEEAYFGLDDLPALFPPGGYASTTYKYDERGNRVQEAYFGLDGRPTNHKDGYHKSVYKYDDFGRRVETAYLDEQGRPAVSKDGHARFTAKYDEQGTRVDTAYFNAENHLLPVRPAVIRVLPMSQGAQLGLKPGDILLQYGGRDISSTSAFIAGRKTEQPGDAPRELVIRRGDALLRFSVRPGLIGVEMNDRTMPEERSPQDKKK